MAASGESDLRTPLLPSSRNCSFHHPRKGLLSKFCHKLRRIFRSAGTSAATYFTAVWKFLTRDPRRVIHAFKMALAIFLAFLLVLLEAPYKQLGNHAVWAIMTVIVVFEVPVGATLSKGCNRGIGTIVAGLLSVGVVELASKAGSIGHPVVIGVSVFFIGIIITFLKHGPNLKSYEYGFRIFLVTFSLILVSGYRQGDPLGIAVRRIVAIALGGSMGLIVNLFVLPIWAGEDLHRSIAKNFGNVADSLEVCVQEYLRGATLERVPSKILMGLVADDPVYKGYRATLVSASNEEALANFAIWEPPHGRFRKLHYPWKQYVKVGAVLRHCTYSIVALHGCMRSAIQAPISVRKIFEMELLEVSLEAAKVLRKLGEQVENMQKSKPGSLLVENVHYAVQQLQKSIYLHSYLLVTSDTQNSEEDLAHYSASSISGAGNQLHSGRLVRSYSGNMLGTLIFPQENLNVTDKRSFKKLRSWPARPMDSFHDATNPTFEQRVRVLESASALSLGTFATLLMEVVSRLDYVVEAVEELSELAHFKEDEMKADEEGQMHC